MCGEKLVFPQLFQATTIPALEQVAAFTSARHDVLAGNVANLDTPGYRVRDLSLPVFQQRLQEMLTATRQPPAAVAAGGSGAVFPPVLPPGQSPGEHALQAEPQMKAVADSMRSILYHDGSDDSLEQQVTEITKNQLLHNLAISIMTSQFRLLQTAISERV